MAESALQREIHEYSEKRGAYVVNQWGTALSGSGVPDVFVCYRGRFVAWECKHPNKRFKGVVYPEIADDHNAEPSQRMHMKRIRKAGGWAFSVNALRPVKAFYDQIDFEEDCE